MPFEDQVIGALIRRLNDVRLLLDADCRAAGQDTTSHLPLTHDSPLSITAGPWPDRRGLAENVQTGRILDVLQHIDGGQTVGDVLDRLAEAIARLQSRVAVFVVDRDHLSGWRVIGFSLEAANARNVSLPIARAGLLREAVESGLPVWRRPVSEGPIHDFAASSKPIPGERPPSDTLAVPLLVDGVVVAALYVDGAPSESPFRARRWATTIEVFARHAGRMLEMIAASSLPALSDDRELSSLDHRNSQASESVLQSVRRSADYPGRERRA